MSGRAHDVVIIGGGPAGSTAATLLARKGYRVALLEKEQFPREHVGESLLPFCYSVFDELGVLPVMKQEFVRKPAVRFSTSDGSRSTNWCFNHVIQNETFLSFQVDRKRFDTILLDNSRASGADVHERTRVSEVRFEDERDLVHVTAVGPDGEERRHTGRFLIDASGRGAFLATANGWRSANKGFERTALWTHWIDVKHMKAGLEEGSSLIVYLGGEKRGWIWAFPLERDRLTVGVVMDSFYLRRRKAELTAAGSTDWQLDLYRRELEESTLIREILDGSARMAMGLMVEGDYSYNSSVKYGRRYALVGDAGRFIDPIFSSGIFLSMKSACLVSDALHRMFTTGMHDHAPLTSAYDYINGAYDFVYRLISLFYNPHSISWAGAGTFFAEHLAHEDAMAAGHFILSGDFFENHKKYHEFLDVLENPRYFDLYRQTVIRRPSLDQPSCKLTSDQQAMIFPKPPGRPV
jgi:flavin-dependent dehydrogenase